MKRRSLRLHDRVCSGSHFEGRFYPDRDDKGTVIQIVEVSPFRPVKALIEWDVPQAPGDEKDIDEVGVLDRVNSTGTPFMLLRATKGKRD